MNRDERRTRADERSPRVATNGQGPAWVGPADGEKGGTWFGANDRGMVACLLNAYVPGDLDMLGREDVPSRGRIIPTLLALEPDAAWQWLQQGLDPTPYPSFTLVVATHDSAEAIEWRVNGTLRREPLPSGWTLVTSSLWRSEDVEAWRRRLFSAWLDGGAEEINGVPAFNLLENPGRREWSPLMTRSFSITKSVTQVEVTAEAPAVKLRYWRRDGESPIDPASPTSTVTLPLTRR